MVFPTSDPYPKDAEPKNTVVARAGAYFWLKSRTFVGRQNPIPPDADAFERIGIVILKDPDGNVLDWGTDELDVSDVNDTKDGSSPDYVAALSVKAVSDGVITLNQPTLTSLTASFSSNDAGKLVVGTGIPGGTIISTIVSATQVTLSQNATATASGVSLVIGTPNTGLFAEGYPGMVTGRYAFKGKAPVNAEQTDGVPSRYYEVFWVVKKFDGPAVDSERFNVGPPANIGFGSGIAPADVRIGFSTSFTDPEIQPYIDAATETVYGDLENGGIADPVAAFEAIGGIPRSLKTAIIELTQCTIVGFDLSAGKRVKSVQEGSEKITFATPKDGFSGDPCTDYSLRVQRWLKKNAPGRMPMIGTVTKPVGFTVDS